jgi:hypothetical protein
MEKMSPSSTLLGFAGAAAGWGAARAGAAKGSTYAACAAGAVPPPRGSAAAPPPDPPTPPPPPPLPPPKRSPNPLLLLVGAAADRPMPPPPPPLLNAPTPSRSSCAGSTAALRGGAAGAAATAARGEGAGPGADATAGARGGGAAAAAAAAAGGARGAGAGAAAGAGAPASPRDKRDTFSTNLLMNWGTGSSGALRSIHTAGEGGKVSRTAGRAADEVRGHAPWERPNADFARNKYAPGRGKPALTSARVSAFGAFRTINTLGCLRRCEVAGVGAPREEVGARRMEGGGGKQTHSSLSPSQGIKYCT